MVNKIGVILNRSYDSGFTFSEEAVAEYKRLKQLKTSNYVPEHAWVLKYDKSLRFDQTMVRVVERLGERASEKPAALKVIHIEEHFRNAVNIITIDGGYEIIEIAMYKYILDEIEKTVDGTDSDHQKLSRIKHLLQQRDDRDDFD